MQKLRFNLWVNCILIAIPVVRGGNFSNLFDDVVKRSEEKLPLFVHDPNPTNLYFVMQNDVGRSSELEEREFRCNVDANPDDVKFFWTKNGEPFELTNQSERLRLARDEGSFFFRALRPNDEGVYVCHAQIGNAIAVDKPINFILTFHGHFENNVVTTVDIVSGESYVHKCDYPQSVPSASVNWLIRTETGIFQTINQSHISTDHEGSIYFHYVTKDDVLRNNTYYTCMSQHTILNDHKLGDQFNLNVLDKGANVMSANVTENFIEMYVTPATVAIENANHKLDCLFSGFPVPTPTWYKDGKKLEGRLGQHNDRFKIFQFGKSLIINNVTAESAGNYVCQFPEHGVKRAFTVNVEAAPYFPSGSPATYIMCENEQIVGFQCNAVGIPMPKFTFFKNGGGLVWADIYLIEGNKVIMLDPFNSTERVENAVYQCKAENKHGFVWANIYVNERC